MASEIAHNSVVKLTASPSGLVTGFQTAANAVTGFESTFGHLQGILIGGLAALGIGLSFESVVHSIHSQMEAVDAMNKQARGLGVTTDALSRLQYAASFAGMSAESVAPMLAKMAKSINGINDAGEETSKKTAAFRTLGLDIQQLMGMSADQQFATIAESIAKVENPTQRLGLAISVFGKQAAQVMPLLLEGKEGLAKWYEESDKLGNTVFPINANKIEQANEGIERIGKAFKGVSLTLAAELSPFVTAATKQLIDWGTSGEGMTAKVVSGFRWVLEAVAKSADYLDVLIAGFYAVQGVAGLALGGLVKLIGLVIQGIEWLTTKLGGTNQHFGDFTRILGDEMVAGAKESFKKAGENWDTFMEGKNSKAVARWFDQTRAAADKAAEAANKPIKPAVDMAGLEAAAKKLEKIETTLADLQKNAEQAGMTKAQKQLDDLKRLGADDTQQQQAAKYLDIAEAAERSAKAQEKMTQEADKWAEKILTPAEKLAQELARIDELQDANKLTAEQAEKARTLATAEADKGTKQQADKLAAMDVYSQQGKAFAMGLGNNGTQLEVAKNTLTESKRHTDHLATIAKNTSRSDEGQTMVIGSFGG